MGSALADRLLDGLRHLDPVSGGLSEGEGLVVGFSGGGDSMALLDLLHRLAPERRLRLVAAHLDHRLRPNSADDRSACEEFCRARGIAFVATAADVAARAERSGAGIEAAGRRARHAFFEAVRRRHGLDRVATGHHLDDHIESIALAVLRGSGLRGLAGIQPVRGRFVRPLRAVRRDLLRAYLTERGLTWREDPSNQDPRRRRNWLRAVGLPELDASLSAVFGIIDWRAQVDALTRRVTQERTALDELVAECLRRDTLHREDGVLALGRVSFEARSEAVRFQMLRAAVESVQSPGSHQRWNEEAYSNVLSFVRRARPGLRWPLPGGGWLQVERESLILTGTSDEYARNDGEPAPEDEAMPALSSELLPTPAVGCSLGEPGTAWLDAARVRPPFTVRTVRPGDRMQPFGMEGHKSVATLLAERSVPRDRRPHQWVVSDADRIVWVVGITTCERARVDASTRAVWRLSIDPPAVPTPGPTP